MCIALTQRAVCCKRHSAVSRQHACRYRRVHQACGWRAAEWQFKFSYLLSQVMPRVFDVASHPSTQDVVYVHEAEEAKRGTTHGVPTSQ